MPEQPTMTEDVAEAIVEAVRSDFSGQGTFFAEYIKGLDGGKTEDGWADDQEAMKAVLDFANEGRIDILTRRDAMFKIFAVITGTMSAVTLLSAYDKWSKGNALKSRAKIEQSPPRKKYLENMATINHRTAGAFGFIGIVEAIGALGFSRWPGNVRFDDDFKKSVDGFAALFDQEIDRLSQNLSLPVPR